MSDSEEKTPTVSPDQGATSETVATQSEQAGGIPSKLPWFLFVGDPMKEYERYMMLSRHKLSPAPPLPPCEQNKFAAFEKEVDFAFDMQLQDNENHDIDLPYEALEAITKQQKRVLEMCKQSAAKAKEDGDISYEQEYIHMKQMEALEKRTLVKMKKSQTKRCLTPTPSEMDMKKICYSPIRQDQDSPTHPGGSTQAEKTTKESKTTDTENEKAEVVYPKRALICLIVTSIILMIISLIRIILIFVL